MDIDLNGMIDMHIHSAPDVRPRLMDDIDVASAAAGAGLRAIMIKSHVLITADRAAIAEKMVRGIRVVGGLALNDAVGGLNPAAVETAIRLGARQVWMPTMSADNSIIHSDHVGNGRVAAAYNPGLTVLDAGGALLPIVYDILALIATAGIALGTGHLSPKEIRILVPAARAQGVRRIIITHPELPLSNIPLSLQQDLAQPGVWFERCYICTLDRKRPDALATIASNIRALGPEFTIVSTDLGQAENVAPVDGLRAYLAGLLELGIPWADLQRMCGANPAAALGL